MSMKDIYRGASSSVKVLVLFAISCFVMMTFYYFIKIIIALGFLHDLILGVTIILGYMTLIMYGQLQGNKQEVK